MNKKDTDFITLLNKYNRLVARLNEYEQQIEGKERAWKKLEEQYKSEIALARELAEKILAKDPNEMVLGKSYSWKSFSTSELLHKATNGFETYNANRTALMIRLKDESEERRMQIESLLDQLSAAQHSPPRIDQATGEVLPTNEELLEKTKQDIKDQKIKASLPKGYQAAEQNGNCQIVVIEENKDFTEQDALDNAEAGLVGHTVKIDSYAAPMHPSEENRQDKQRRKAAEKYTELIDIEAAASGIKEAGWNALLAIGKYGVSTTSDITNVIQGKIVNGDKTLTNRATSQLVALQAGGLIEKSVITDGIRSKLIIYTLSPKGRRVYEYKYKEKPIISEAERLSAENDNIQHGYGIKALKEVLQGIKTENDTPLYHDTSISRSKNIINLSNGKKYIPDVKASNGVGVDFFEYEIGTTSAQNIEIKLNKMCQVTKDLHIVYPSIDVVNKNAPKVEKWIESRGSKSLSQITVYLHTSKSISRLGVANGWICKYECKNGAIRIDAPNTNSSKAIMRGGEK